MRESERIRLDNGRFAAWWFHFSLKSYDVVYSDDWTKHGNRLHHIAFAPDTREDILKAADIFLENGIHIESGPHKHAINQTFFLYVWEPGGNRIEFANAGARLLLDPDQPVVEWSEEERKKGQAWGMKTIETFHTHGTPVVDAPRNDSSRSGGSSRMLACHDTPEDSAVCDMRALAGRSAPDVVGDVDDLADLRPLLVLGEHVALLGRGEPALRAQRELIEGSEGGCLVDALLDGVDVLELAALGRDESEHDGLVALGQEPQRLEAAGALAVVLEEVPVVVRDSPSSCSATGS